MIVDDMQLEIIIIESGSTAVMVSGAKGKPPPESYKVRAGVAP